MNPTLTAGTAQAAPAAAPMRRSAAARVLRWMMFTAGFAALLMALALVLAFGGAGWLLDSSLALPHVTVNGEPLDLHGALEGTGPAVFVGLGTAALVVVLLLFIALPVLVLVFGLVGLIALGAVVLAVLVAVLVAVSAGALVTSPLILIGLAFWGGWALWARSRRPRVLPTATPAPSPQTAPTDYPAGFNVPR